MRQPAGIIGSLGALYIDAPRGSVTDELLGGGSRKSVGRFVLGCCPSVTSTGITSIPSGSGVPPARRIYFELLTRNDFESEIINNRRSSLGGPLVRRAPRRMIYARRTSASSRSRSPRDRCRDHRA